MDRAWARHSWPRVRFALLALTLALNLVGPAGPSDAAESPCQPPAGVAAITAAPIDERVSALPPHFRPLPVALDRAALLERTQQRVLAELAEIGAPACYAAEVPTIAARTAFLSPFEFVVVGYFEHDFATRDEVLRLYREDPPAAIRRIASFWPSPKAEMLIRTPAFFDIDTNQIYVNLGVVTAEQAPNVVAHEFWHALANVRLRPLADGAELRTTGFWTERRQPGTQVWRPVDETVPGGIPTYLMNEAVAIEMEVAATGRQHDGMRPDLAAAVETLHELFAAAGRERVLRLYLESRSEELQRIAHEAVRPEQASLRSLLLADQSHPCGPGCCCHATVAEHRAAQAL